MVGRRTDEDRELIRRARELLDKLEREGGILSAEDLEAFQQILHSLIERVERKPPSEEQEE